MEWNPFNGSINLQIWKSLKNKVIFAGYKYNG
mgnify:CR=1 FL=1